MAAPTLTLLNSQSLSTAESTTGWTQFDLLDADFVKEGSNSITGPFRADGVFGYFDNGSAPVTAVGKTFRMWINTTNVAYMDTEANGGYELLVYDGTTTQYITFISSDDYFGGWFQVVMDMDLFTSLTLANVRRWGIRCQHHTAAKNVDNVWVDALKYLDGYSMTGGTSGDKIRLQNIELADRGTSPLYGYGVLTVFGGVYYCTGKIQFGTGATTTYFEMDGQILVFENKPIAEGLYSLSGVGSGTNVLIQNSVIISAGTTDATRFVFDWSDTDLASFSCLNNRIVRAGAVTFKSGQTVSGTTFDDCGVIDPDGATLSEVIIKNANVSGTTEGSLMVNVDTEGEACTDMTFEEYTGATTYAVFVAASVTEFDMDNWQFDDPNNTTSYAVYWAGTAGTLTINALSGTNLVTAGCTSAGGTVTVVSSFSHTVTGLELNTEVTYVTAGTSTELYHVENATTSDGDGKYQVTYTHGGGATVDILIHHVDYKPDISNLLGITLPSANATAKVQMFSDENYYNPT